MLGELPVSLNLNGVDYAICPDYRIALLIFSAYEDPDCSERDRSVITIRSLYEDPDSIPPEDTEEALKKAVWFLDGGGEDDQSPTQSSKAGKIISWMQDEQMIFSAVNKVAGKELRSPEPLHWWTFLGYFSEVGECLLTQVITIRRKKQQGKKLDKGEEDFYKRNRSIVDIRRKYSTDEIKEREALNEILNKGGVIGGRRIN